MVEVDLGDRRNHFWGLLLENESVKNFVDKVCEVGINYCVRNGIPPEKLDVTDGKITRDGLIVANFTKKG